MEEKQIKILIEKYLSGKASLEEKKSLEIWYKSQLEDDIVWDLEDQSFQSFENKIKSAIWEETVNKHAKLKYRKRISYSAAAAILLFSSFLIFLQIKQKDFQQLAKTPINQVENRHIILPDSSIVILRPGSEILLSKEFGIEDREVELIGEAYFDVTPNKIKPFIINSANIKTTVLGTAFSILANPNGKTIEVIVDHGKVRVEKENKTLGILQAKQKLIIPENQRVDEDIKILNEVSKNEMAWMEEDMNFEALTFSDLTKKLERRYQVNIELMDPKLANLKISGVYKGTEKLEEVLTNLCVTTNTTFIKLKNKRYQIKENKNLN
ncbi:FecR family protein [Sphingobacterium sp. PU5-4]|uniref:FecR family protein n=1 Tax=Sphingobacterium tenebrionis TaxID=3111775 RepID=A0ABU8I1V3_9SPHI